MVILFIIWYCIKIKVRKLINSVNKYIIKILNTFEFDLEGL